MKKLFLSSSFVDVFPFLEPFVKEKLENKRVTCIQTASTPEEYRGYVENDRAAFEKLGLVIEKLDISSAPIGQIKKMSTKK